MKLVISDDDVGVFLAYLSLGVLEALRARAVPATIGGSTMGRPQFWQPVRGLVSEDVMSVMRAMDELDFGETVEGLEATDRSTGRYIERALGVLRSAPRKDPDMEWEEVARLMEEEDRAWGQANTSSAPTKAGTGEDMGSDPSLVQNPY